MSQKASKQASINIKIEITYNIFNWSLTLVYLRYFCNTSTEGVGVTGNHSALDFRYKASDSYDFGTRG